MVVPDKTQNVKTSFISGYKPYIKRRDFPNVRCSFWLLAWASGCRFNCKCCWLRAYHPWPWREIHIAEKPALVRTIRNFCKRIGGAQLLNAGELCDSFIAPEYIGFMASQLREANELHGCSHKLLLLTKSADPWPLLKGAHQDVVVYSVSVNTETIAKQLEHEAPSPSRRIHAAWRLREAGCEVRVRVDPIIAVSNPACGFESHPGSNPGDRIPAGSEPAYVGLMERVCVFIEPALITLGCLGATPRTYRSLPDPIRAQLTESTPWGWGYPLETRLSLYDELINAAKDCGVPVALRKEPPEVRRVLKLRPKRSCRA